MRKAIIAVAVLVILGASAVLLLIDNTEYNVAAFIAIIIAGLVIRPTTAIGRAFGSMLRAKGDAAKLLRLLLITVCVAGAVCSLYYLPALSGLLATIFACLLIIVISGVSYKWGQDDSISSVKEEGEAEEKSDFLKRFEEEKERVATSAEVADKSANTIEQIEKQSVTNSRSKNFSVRSLEHITLEDFTLDEFVTYCEVIGCGGLTITTVFTLNSAVDPKDVDIVGDDAEAAYSRIKEKFKGQALLVELEEVKNE